MQGLVRAASTPPGTQFKGEMLLMASLIGVAISFFWTLAPLDPDPHHDGYQFAVALAVSEGLTPHIDVFSQYGPATAELQGLILRTWDPTILTLRYSTALLLGMVAGTGYLLARALRLNRTTSAIAVVSWTLLCPAAGVYSDSLQLWPWSSVLFTLVVQIAVLLVLLAIAKRNSPWLWVLVGLVLVLCIWIRLNQGIPVALALLLALLIHREGRSCLQKQRWMLAVGGFLGVVGGILYFLLRSDFNLYLRDAVLGPVNRFVVEDFDGSDRVLAPVELGAVLGGSFLAASMPLLLVSTVVFFMLRRPGTQRSTVVLLVLVAIFTLMMFAALGVYGRPRSIAEALIPWNVGVETLNALSSSPLYAAWLLIIPAVVTILWLSIQHQRSPVTAQQVVAVFVAAALGTQVVPRWDVYHLWWAGPLIIVAVLALVAPQLPSHRVSLFAATVLLPYMIVAGLAAWATVSQPRVTAPDGSLRGMMVLPERAHASESLSRLSIMLTPRRTQLLCADGLYAALGVQFVSDRADFVSWGWSGAPRPRQSPEYILVCGDDPSDFSAANGAIPPGYALIQQEEAIALSPWSQTEFHLYRKTT